MGAVVLNVVDADPSRRATPEETRASAKLATLMLFLAREMRRFQSPGADGYVAQLPPEMRLRVAVNCDMGERRWIDLAQASLGGQGRKAGPVLDAIKSLLFYRDRELAIREEGGRSVAVEGVETEYVH